MKRIITIFSIVLFTIPLFSVSLVESPVDADIIVAADSSGDFITIQAAIDAAPSASERRTVIYIKRGLYNTEKLIIPSDKINLTFIGESREETVISYHIYDCDGGKCPAEDAALWIGDNIRTSATLTILGDGFRAENLTIQNTAGPVGQAQAITVRADKCVFINVDLYGYQDTIYFWSDGNRSYFENCLVVGRTDYIYGSGTVFFQSCEIRSWGGGWITAPSTGLEQLYGFVFNECQITYAENSPRVGDDGQLVKFGRPWHNYPKVAWLNCEMTGMINPLGWGDIWNMTYADTSTDLHLYEYNNTGDGADMSGRADWAGIKELTEVEAMEYTVQKVMAGDDGWDPSAEAPLVQTYNWTGNGDNDGWLVAQNWDPEGTPVAGESAIVDSAFIIVADGDTFPADLSLRNMAELVISDSSVAEYISVANATISTSEDVTLNGKIGTKDSINFDIEGKLTLNSTLTGVHQFTKLGTGTLLLIANNSNFSGNIGIVAGTLQADSAFTLGKSFVNVEDGATLTIGHENALFATSKLEVVTGATLHLNADVTITEFYIDGVMQTVGEYTSTTNPALISGDGKIIIGRPEIFVFHRGEDNGNWDIAEHFTPALLPEAGETVICEEEIETTATVFEADIIIQNGGRLRLRGSNHKCTGTIFMNEGTSISYTTSGTGMYIDAPINIEDTVTFNMESNNVDGSTMTIAGPVSGNGKVIILNNGRETVNSGNVLLKGDNNEFTGTWDLTHYSNKNPDVEGYISILQGDVENAFGKGKIVAALDNKVIFSQSKAAGDTLDLTLTDNAKALLTVTVYVKQFIFNGDTLSEGEFSSTTHPDFFEGVGKIYIGEDGSDKPDIEMPAFPGAEGHGMYATGGRGGQVINVTTLEDNSEEGSLRYAVNQIGPRVVVFKVSGTIQLQSSLNITNDDITIAGQTAPGDGITLRDYPVTVDADNVIIRFLRFRMGDAAQQEADALGGRYHQDIIIDHCSMSWSTDECVSFYRNENFTLQWCIVSESLKNSVHEKGSHGYGGIWGGKNASFHHNLLAHHDSRNPRLGEDVETDFALTDLVDLRNNVIYNWGGNSCYGGEAMNVNIVNCYYKAGPATSSTRSRIISIDKMTETGYPKSNIWGKFYINGNVVTSSSQATNDNWTYGVYNQFHSSYGTVSQADKDAMRLSEPLDPGEVTTHSAEAAYLKILDFGGACFVRDTIDKRIIHDVRTGTATCTDGGNGSYNGIIDTQSAVNGWPDLESDDAPFDTDEDGMPNVWEIFNGLNMNDPTDASVATIDTAYTNIEVYINSLVGDIVEKQNKDTVATSIEFVNAENENISLYLDNANNQLVISHEKAILNTTVYNLTGQVLLSNNGNQKDLRLDVSELKKGIYIVSVRDVENSVYSKKVIRF